MTALKTQRRENTRRKHLWKDQARVQPGLQGRWEAFKHKTTVWYRAQYVPNMAQSVSYFLWVRCHLSQDCLVCHVA